MATEGPLFRDGSQTTAWPANYNSTNLAGPGGTGQYLAVDISAARTVAVQTTVGGTSYGVLQNTPTLGAPADVGILGISKMVAGASVTAGAELMVDASGRFITWVSGSSYFKVGLAIETPTAAGVVFTGLIYSPNYKVVT